MHVVTGHSITRILFSLVGAFRIRCICHALHNITVKNFGYGGKDGPVEKVRDLVKYVKRPKAKKMFRTFVNRTHLKLPLDVETRWNSTLYLLQGAYASRKDLAKFLELKGSTLIKKKISTDQEWEQIRILSQRLEPFDKASIDCAAAKSATLHIGKQSFITLEEHLRVFKTKHITVSRIQ